MKTIFYLWITLFLIMSCTSAQTQDKGTPIPLDPELRYGQLDNGFTYYIRNLKSDESRINISLLGPGSWLEDDDQLGLAHLAEHLVVRPNSINEFRQTEGTTGYWGAVNTAPLRVQYGLVVPGSDPDLLTKTLHLMRRLAWDEQVLQNTQIPEKVDNERGTVLEEYRGHDLLSKTKQYKLLNSPKGNKYYDPAISQSQHNKNIKNFKKELLTRFYKDWYRPDQEAIFIVGDIDVDQVEKQIRELFSDLKNPENAPEKDFQEYLDGARVELTGNNQFITLSDKKQEKIQLEVYIKHRSDNIIVTEEQFRENLIQQLYNSMAASRFLQLNQQYLSPYVSVYHNWGKLGKSELQIDAFHTHAVVRDISSLQSSLKGIMTTLEQIKKWGFTEAELTKAKEDVLEAGRKRISNISDLAQKYEDHFLLGAAAPGPDYEQRLRARLLESITREEVLAAAKKYFTDKNRDIVLTVPESLKDSLPDKEVVEGWIDEVRDNPVSRYEDPLAMSGSLLTKAQEKQLSEDIDYTQTDIAKFGAQQLDLANGIRIILKPLSSKDAAEQRISFVGQSPRGRSFYHGEDRIAALKAGAIITHSGAGGHDKFALERYLKDKDVSVSPSIGKEGTTINGSSSLKDLETMLQLIYLYFTTPNKNEKAFKEWKSATSQLFRRIENMPGNVIRNLVEGRPYTAFLGAHFTDIEQMRLDNVYRIYKECFANAGDFTFVFSGDFNPDDIKPLLLKYLGNLPVTSRSLSGERIPSPDQVFEPLIGVDTVLYRKNANNSPLPVHLYYFKREPFDEATALKMEMLGTVLRNMLWSSLPNEGIYSGLGASSSYDHENGCYRGIIQFDSDKIEKTRNALNVIDKIIGELDETDVNKLLEGALDERKRKIERERNTDRSGSWTEYFASGAYLKGKPDPIEDDREDRSHSMSLLDQVTAKELVELAQHFFRKAERTRVAMLPENEKNTNLFK